MQPSQMLGCFGRCLEANPVKGEVETMKKAILVAMVAAFFCAVSAKADGVVDLTFEGIAPYPNANDVSILGYYDGGTSSIGTTGTNYGISFPENALLICLNTVGTSCSNTSRGGLGDPNSQQGALFFLQGTDTYLDDPAGFTTGFSFNYTAENEGGTISVWSGLDGTGTELGSLTLPTTPSTCDPAYSAGFCPFVAAGLTFDGVAESIDFNGVANQIVFDDVTFGSSTPGNPTVPEPASLLLLSSGILSLGAFRRKSQKA
jgi:hypothetical protein